MLQLPAPLLPSPFVYPLMLSTNIDLLLMLVTMLDIVKKKKKTTTTTKKNHDQFFPLSGAQSMKGEKYNKINDNTVVSSIRETFIK